MSLEAPGGGGDGDLVIPGNPAELAAAAQVYRTAAGGMSDAASQLRASLGEAAAWLGTGATSHAAHVQILAENHQLASDALYAGSAALSTYSSELAQAQALASRANAATSAASATAAQLGSVVGAEATASKTNGNAALQARTGNMGLSSYDTDVAQQNRLQATLSDHQGQAGSLTTQALAMANQAAAKAAASFNQVAGTAGTGKKSPFGAGDVVTGASYVGGLAGAPYTRLKNVLSKAKEDVTADETLLAKAQNRVRAASRMRAVGKAKGKVKAARASAAEAETNAEAALKNAKSAESSANAALDHFNAVAKGLGVSARDVYTKGSSKLGLGGSAAQDGADGADGLGGVLGDSIPVVGVALTAGAATWDWKHGRHLDAAGDVGGFAASVAAGAVVVLLVGTPVGWAVLGTFAVAAGVGMAVTEAIDHYKGLVTAGEAVGHGLEAAGRGIGHAAEGVGHGIGDAAGAVTHEAKKLTSWIP